MGKHVEENMWEIFLKYLWEMVVKKLVGSGKGGSRNQLVTVP